MTILRLRPAVAVLVTALLVSAPARAAVPEYRLGDVAAEEVVTPVPLFVVNPDATEALRQMMAQQVPSIVRRTVPSAAEAETELRAAVAAERTDFLAALQVALNGRAPTADDLDTPAFVSTVRDASRDAPKNPPIVLLAPFWVRGASDEAVVESLLQPVREIMAQPIVADKEENPLPANLPVRLIPVKNLTESPGMLELETAGATVTVGKIISLARARRVVETYFPSGQEAMGRFAAAFVRTNAYVSPGLSELLRAKRLEGVAVNDRYDAAQVIVKKGQTIDRRALGALAAVREKSLIGALQTKLEEEEWTAIQVSRQTKWIAAGLAAMGLLVGLLLGRRRNPPGNALVPASLYEGLPGSERHHALPGGEGNDHWRSRAMVAEVRVERAHEAIRTGALGWMRDKIFQTLFHQRAELLSVQQKAEAEMRELEQRLEQLHTPLQERITAYEKRIEELEQDLAAKGEENRELIGARISVAKQQLNVERSRFGTT